MSSSAVLKRAALWQILPFAFFCGAVSPLFAAIPPSSLAFMPPMNEIYHPVSTDNPDAQKSFDRGLTYIFAFNHDLSFREFEKAANLDPKLAMAYWGMALALGQNINEDIKPEHKQRCYDYIQKALSLSSTASRSEQDYIKALAVRYSNDSSIDPMTLRFRYRDSMKKLVEAYPEDLDAAAMYAESLLDLDPWKWWTQGGKPKEETLEAMDVLESVLLRNQEHIGANHYYVHALEESPYPERALMSAHRLEYLLPESGHLLHMPCHIFILVGDYEAALKTNKKAIAQDKEYIEKFGMSSGTYPLHYLTHNLVVLSKIYMLMEDYPNARDSSLEVVKFIGPHIASMPQMAYNFTRPLHVYLYFHKWKEILDYPLQTNYPPALAFWHYSRAEAFAALGDLDSAQKEKELMLMSKEQIKEDEIANNPAEKVIALAEIVLDASFARARGKNLDSISLLKEACALQGSLNYDEPSAWAVPIFQTLGFAQLLEKQYAEGEKSFRKAQRSLHRNGRTLFGLFLSLQGQNQTMDAYWVEREMTAALKNASAPLNLGEMWPKRQIESGYLLDDQK